MGSLRKISVNIEPSPRQKEQEDTIDNSKVNPHSYLQSAAYMASLCPIIIRIISNHWHRMLSNATARHDLALKRNTP